jgi:carbon-monoxide dehydrogenase small subunit
VFGVQADGAEVRTVEGLADGDELSDLQQAFRDHHALQCGFCTPGFLMLAEAYFAERGLMQPVSAAGQPSSGAAYKRPTGAVANGSLAGDREPVGDRGPAGDRAGPDEAEIRELVASNLCRCTGYQGIVAAILATATARRITGRQEPGSDE